jgi:SAM-dependent methyltransferase
MKPKNWIVKGDPLWEEKFILIKKHLHVKNGTLLDLGCGNGYFLENLNLTGIGIDNDDEGLDICRKKGLTVRKMDLNKSLNLVNKHDIILCLDTLEHLIYPQIAVKEAYRLLKDDGIFVVSVPYHHFWKNLTITLFDWNNHYDYEDWHIRFFSEKLFRKILNENGFKIFKLYKIGRIYIFKKNMVAFCKKEIK